MKNKHYKEIGIILILVLVLTGCAQTTTTEPASNLWNTFIVFLAQGIILFSRICGGSIGFGIIIMTLLVRVILIPLYKKQIISQEQMKEVQPKVDAIKKKYSGKKSQENTQKQQVEINALYKEHKINPLAGCLPMLIQMPILIGFYKAIYYLAPPQSVIDSLTKNGTDVIYGLKELNAPDITISFMGINLNEPVVAFAIIAAIATFFVSYVSMLGMDKTSPGAGVSKSMMYVMPIMIFFMGLSFPGALSIYWVVSNTVTVLQTLYFKRSHLQNSRQKKKFN